MAWRIVPLCVGVLRDRPKESITFRRGTGKTVDLACFSWLLEGGGDPIVIDTGPGSAELTRSVHSVKLEERQGLAEQLAARGYDPAQIRTVILTHLHWDHCYRNALLPNADLWVQESEIRYSVFPLPCDHLVYEFETRPPFLSELTRMRGVDGTMELVPGVTLIPTPGHSPGHQSVLVTTADGPQLIAGDQYDLFENLHDACPSGPTVDLASWYRSHELVRRLGANVLPGHDMAVLDHAVYG
ncbi:MAG TPA: N-acyl homoserine lactonase family protein [Candidatus Nitrosotalea sp.]|nr:N-acyl homoserine lactonase family protein [Candidatus Nitrosotalea sp.]